MTLRTLTFVIANRDTGAATARGVIAPSARYASVAWMGGERLDRRIVYPADWKLSELALRDHLPTVPLEAAHVVVRIPIDAEKRPSVTVQYVADPPMDVASPAETVNQLDAALRAIAV